MVVVVGLNAWVPLIALAPVQPLLAVQVVALVDDQVTVMGLPLVTEAGVAEIVTVGTGVAAVTVMVTLWLAEPAVLVQVKV